MHVAFVIPTICRIGGAERQVLLLAHGLRRRGVQVSIVALSGTGAPEADALAADSIAYTSLKMRKGLCDPRGWWKFQRWLRRERPDVVHAHLPHAAWFARWSRLLAPKAIVVDSIHTSSTGSAGRRLGYRLSDWLPSAVTAVSQSVADAYVSAGMVAREHLTVLPNGIELSAWTRDETARTQARMAMGAGDAFVWLAAGRLEPVKDYTTLLRAFALVDEPAQLLIAGSGAEQARLRRMADELGLGTRVRFLGFQEELKRWMLAADGFVSASLWEGLPMAVLEAAACALPAVVTAVPGNSEAVIHTETGLLVPKERPEELAAGMKRVMQTPVDVRRAMGESARKMVLERYDLEHVLDAWMELYGRLMTQAAASQREQSTASNLG